MAKDNRLYSQALQTLKKEIFNGTYPFQSKLPSEETLSKTLNISRSTLRKILKTLNGEGIIESRQGSGSFVCNKGINRYIPIIIPNSDPTNRMMEIIEGAHHYFDSMGFSPLLIPSDCDPQKERELINKLTAEGHRNFIIYPSSSSSNNSFYRTMLKEGYACVFIDTLPDGITCDYVTSCNSLGGYEATKRLIASGYKEIAFCGFPNPQISNTIGDRYSGYISALEQNGITPEASYVFMSEDNNIEKFADSVAERLTAPAVFASTDLLAVTVLNRFKNSNRPLPAVVSFDNSILSESFDLTSVDQNLYEIGRAAAEILHKRILNPFKSYEHIFVPVKLIERGSVKPCADGKF